MNVWGGGDYIKKERKISKVSFVVLEGKVKDIITENKLCVIKTPSHQLTFGPGCSTRKEDAYTHWLEKLLHFFPTEKTTVAQTLVSTPKSLQDPTIPKLAFNLINHTNGFQWTKKDSITWFLPVFVLFFDTWFHYMAQAGLFLKQSSWPWYSSPELEDFRHIPSRPS